jgi:hypothetical protein
MAMKLVELVENVAEVSRALPEANPDLFRLDLFGLARRPHYSRARQERLRSAIPPS